MYMVIFATIAYVRIIFQRQPVDIIFAFNIVTLGCGLFALVIFVFAFKKTQISPFWKKQKMTFMVKMKIFVAYG